MQNKKYFMRLQNHVSINVWIINGMKMVIISIVIFWMFGVQRRVHFVDKAVHQSERSLKTFRYFKDLWGCLKDVSNRNRTFDGASIRKPSSNAKMNQKESNLFCESSKKSEKLLGDSLDWAEIVLNICTFIYDVYIWYHYIIFFYLSKMMGLQKAKKTHCHT